MVNKLTDEDIEHFDKIITKCSTVQLVLLSDSINKKLYDKLKKKKI